METWSKYVIKHQFKNHVYLVATTELDIIIKFVDKNSNEPYFYDVFNKNFSRDAVKMYSYTHIRYEDAVKITQGLYRIPRNKDPSETLILMELEYIEKTLYDVLKLPQNQSGQKLYTLFMNSILVLDTIHVLSIAHNDVSLHNMMYQKTGTYDKIRFIDFEDSCGQSSRGVVDCKNGRMIKTLEQKQLGDVWDLITSIYDILNPVIKDLLDVDEVIETINKYSNTHDDKYTKAVIETMKYVINSRGTKNAEMTIRFLRFYMDLYNLYDFIELLGEGGEGSVFKVRKKRNGDIIAVKLIEMYKPLPDTNYMAVYHKIKLLSRPECSPFLSCVYDYYVLKRDGVFAEMNVLVVEMKYIEGIDLYEYSKNLHEQGMNETLYKHLLLITKDITEGLYILHTNNILHNDIKPQNIVIDRILTPVLVDYGVACKSIEKCDLGTKKVNCCKENYGTLVYFPPEADRNIRYPSSDIWSLGVTLYNVATNGKFPFDFSSALYEDEVISIINNSNPSLLNTSNHLLNYIVNKSLQKDPEDRITLDEIQRLLEDY